MILKRGALRRGEADANEQRESGGREWLYASDTGGLTQFGAYVDTLAPGYRAPQRHWHEKEDEFLYVLAGELTILENDGEHTLQPGDVACWPAGVPNAHAVANRSTVPCTFLVVGTRVTHDVCHYPDNGTRLLTEGERWRVESADGTVLRSGTCKSPPGRD